MLDWRRWENADAIGKEGAAKNQRWSPGNQIAHGPGTEARNGHDGPSLPVFLWDRSTLQRQTLGCFTVMNHVKPQERLDLAPGPVEDGGVVSCCLGNS